MTETRSAPPRFQHGASPVPVAASTAGGWTPTRQVDDRLGQLQAAAAPTVIERLTDEDARTLQLARRPLRPFATTPVVGLEGGAGRTTVVRLIGRAFAELREDSVAAVDLVPRWGGLSEELDAASPCTVQDMGTMAWPPTVERREVVRTAFAADGPVPTLTSARVSVPYWPSPDVALEAVSRVSQLVAMTIVDTVADPLSEAVRKLIWSPRTAPVWVCPATRDGLWAVGEAIDHFERLGAVTLASRSVIAVAGHGRRWPSQAAAAEVQLTGQGLEIVRVPCSGRPLSDHRCERAARRLLAAAVARSA